MNLGAPERPNDHDHGNCDSDPDVFRVNCILAERRRGRGRAFLLEWACGCESSWEPARNVSDDLIVEFDLGKLERAQPH